VSGSSSAATLADASALDGVEKWEATWDKEQGKLIKTHFPRRDGLGLYVRETDLGGADVFRIRQFPGGIFCTAPVRQLIEKNGFTNVAFLEMGDSF
jgi:hypothetical protein